MSPRRLAAVALCAGAAAVLLTAGAAPARADVTASGALRLARIPDDSTSFQSPLDLAAAPGEPGRVFVVERAGRIWLVEGSDPPRLFLDLHTVVNSWSGVTTTPSENGLASIAFAPDYATSGRFFVFYTSSAPGDCDPTNSNFCDDRLVEFRRSGADPDAADPTAVRTVLVVPHRDSAVHHSGQLQFGYDGLLYVSTGDGGNPGDGNHRAQDPSSLSGKLLRLDVDAGNPTPQQWALGVRNPYRYAFDAGTGDLFLGEVGENTAEEIDHLAFGAAPGANFGWSACEGNLLFVPGPAGSTHDPCPSNPVPGYVPPLLTYPHSSATFCSGAVVGGYVVRDPTVPELLGRYLYGDYCQGWIRSVDPSAAGGAQDTGLSVALLSAFGQDANCRLYVTSLAGPVYRLDSTAGSATASCPPAPRLRPATTSVSTGSSSPVPRAVGDGPPPAPVITRLAMTRRRFAVSLRATAIRAASPRGSAFVYRLSEPATVTIAIDRRLAGRRGAGGRCLAPTPRRGRRCTRYRRRGALVRAARAGPVRTAFSGRIGRWAMAPGTYRATLRARTAGRLSSPRSTTFEIVR